MPCTRPADAPVHLPQQPRRLTSDFAGKPENEYLTFYEHGVDGLFSDFAGHGVRGAQMFVLKRIRPTRCLVEGAGRR
jgi:glycerophosphoryl diester phosphodiesterase